MHVMRFVAFTVFILLLGTSHVESRELAADGDKVRLEISSSYECDSTASIHIGASSADYFDQDAETLQRLVNTARAILSFECPKISEIKLTGFTDSTAIFKADASKSKKWALQTEPAPLEALALFFSLYEPNFFHLGTLYEQLKPYREITGIRNTYQFKAYEREIHRLLKVADGDMETFRAYLKNPGREFESFEKALAHYDAVLATIQTYTPQHYPAYNQVYTEVSNALKNDYWNSLVVKIVEDEEKTTAQIVADGIELTRKSSTSPEFAAFVDNYIASWISEDATFVKADLADAPLNEVAWASEYVAGFPNLQRTGRLSKTNELIQKLPSELIPLIAQRKEELEELATNTIKESGTSYEDVDTILETGFALAEKFEEVGFAEEGEALIALTVSHIDSVLKSGLAEYQNELSAITFTGETAAALQEQALAFEDLSAEFEAFVAYKDAVENTLDANKGIICEGILKDANINPREFQKRISLGDSQVTLPQLACNLSDNHNDIVEFSPAEEPGFYTLGITEEDGTNSRFLLETDNANNGQDLRVQSRLGEEESPVSEDEWKEYIAQLVVIPPSGKPDALGIRECDQLAADPADPKKLAPGVDFEKKEIDLDIFERTIEACIAAVENDPDDARQQFQLGRILWYADDQETAGEYIKLAAAANYAPALYYQAQILLGSSDDENAFIDAIDMYKASGKGGYEPGNDKVKELNIDDSNLFRKIPPPTGDEIVNALTTNKASKSFFGLTVSSQVVGATVKECFQDSATDFTCEYKVIMKCGMTSDRPDPRADFMSILMQADCNTAQYQFRSFRKLDHGNWKEIPSKF